MYLQISCKIKKKKKKVLVTQSCPALRHPMKCNPSVSSVHGILQAKLLEWVAIPFSRGSFQPRGPLHCRQILYHLSHYGVLQLKTKKKRIFLKNPLVGLKNPSPSGREVTA